MGHLWSRHEAIMLRQCMTLILCLALAVNGGTAYCCFVLEMTSDSPNLPDGYLGHYVRNYTGLEKINDHLFWRNIKDEQMLIFWDTNANAWAIGNPENDCQSECVAHGPSDKQIHNCPELLKEGWDWLDHSTNDYDHDDSAQVLCTY